MRSSLRHFFLAFILSAVFIIGALQLESGPIKPPPDLPEVHFVPPLSDGSRFWMGQLLPPRTSEEDLRHRPFLYWRAWASQPLPVVPTYFFFWATNTIACFAFPKTMTGARQVCRTQFWKSLLIGITRLGGCMLLGSILFRSGIGTPLAIVTLGVEEAVALFGIAVTSTLTARRLLLLLGMSRFMGGATMRMMLEGAFGAFIITLINLIPGIGILPPIGLRIMALLAILGMGATVLRIRQHVEKARANDAA